MTPADIPLPSDPRHQRYADLRLRGMAKAEAYLAAGYKCAPKSASTGARRLELDPEVRAYMAALQGKAADDTTLSLLEIRRFFARIVRIPITQLSPDQDANADLIKSYATTEAEGRSSFRLEKLDPLKAIELDVKLSGADPDANAAKIFADLLLNAFSSSPIPNDQL